MGFLSNLFNANRISAENEQLRQQIAANEKKYKDSGFNDYETQKIRVSELQSEFEDNRVQLEALHQAIVELESKRDKLDSQINSSTRKLEKMKTLYNAAAYAIDKYSDLPNEQMLLPTQSNIDISELTPTIDIHIHSMDIKDLQKAFRENDKRITELTESYRGRYTTKANQTIFALMVIALRAELQNILYNLKYEKLSVGIQSVEAVTAKYQKIACEGNQSIAGTITKFIGEIEYLFINAVRIEYNYYVRKEQARQEQIAIREQMKQEAAERKALEAEKKKIDAEESKYRNQIKDISEKLENSTDSEKESLKKRLLELETQLNNVIVKKDEIVNLQNGKAGNVYIISNLGSFGDSMFKIGMTRRIDPQERIDELGSASVPFEFDVHSFIFSDNAVELENKLHERLSEKRVNKVNMRKEFFYCTLDELEALTHEISPTAEFNRTMAAEEYRQSLSVTAGFSPEPTSTLSEYDQDE